jgi:hypothetical protein
LNQFGFDNKHSINTYQEKTMKLVSLLTNMNKITLVAITGLILSTSLVACSSNPAAPDAMKQDSDAMKKDGGAMKKDSDAMKKDGGAMKKDDDAMKKDGDAMKKDGGAMKKDGDAMKKDGDAMKQSPSPTSKP